MQIIYNVDNLIVVRRQSLKVMCTAPRGLFVNDVTYIWNDILACTPFLMYYYHKINYCRLNHLKVIFTCRSLKNLLPHPISECVEFHVIFQTHRRPSLFTDFLSANLLIQIGQKCLFPQSKMFFFYLRIQYSWSKMKERIYRE